MQKSLSSGGLLSKLTLGLEIGFSSIKAVWFRSGAGGGEIIDFAIEEIDPQTRDISVPLARISRRVKASSLRAVAVLSGEGIYEGATFIPPMPEKEVGSFLRMTMIERGGLNLTDPVVKYFYSGIKAAGKKQAVITLAADSSHWKNILDQVIRSRIPLTSLIFPAVAYKSLIAPPRDNLLLVDIGAGKTTVYLYREGELAFVRREDSLGAENLTREMTIEVATEGGTVQLNPEQAERIKSMFGIPTPDRMKDKVEGIRLGEVWPMIRPWCDRLVGAVKDSMVFYQQYFPPARIKTVYLTGGGALLPNLPAYLSEKCGCEVSLLTIPDNISWSSAKLKKEYDQVAPRLQVALGSAQSSGEKINLLPLKNIISRKLLIPARILWIVLPIVVIILIALGQVTARQMRFSAVRAEQLDVLLSEQRSEAEKWRRIFSEEEKIQNTRRFIRESLHHPDLWIGIFLEISRAIPDQIVLTRLIMEHVERAGVLTFEGKVFSPGSAGASGERPEQILTSFISRLMRSPFFSNSRNLEAGEGDDGLFRFTFMVTLQRWEGK